MANAWIIVVNPEISTLVDLGRQLGGVVRAVVVGDAQIEGVDEVIRIPLPEGSPSESAAPVVCKALALEDGDVILAANSPEERVLAGFVAGALRLPILFDLKSLKSGVATVSRYGGIAIEEIAFSSPVVAVANGGTALEGTTPTEQTVNGEFNKATISEERISPEASINLASAKRIVAAGRGFKAKEDLQLAEALAKALGAQLGCSRPLAEGSEWLQRGQYIGISGQHVSPELYVAIGISGQIQHVAGMSDSTVVLAINSDENAPIFELSDYGVVGDLYEVLPQLTSSVE